MCVCVCTVRAGGGREGLAAAAARAYVVYAGTGCVKDRAPCPGCGCQAVGSVTARAVWCAQAWSLGGESEDGGTKSTRAV